MATLAVAIRAADAGGLAARAAFALAAVGYLLWIAALVATAAGVADGVTLAVGQTLAMVGTVGVGLAVIRVGDDLVGMLLVLTAATMLIPWTLAWLAFGACWTVIGIVLEFDRVGRPDDGQWIS